MNWDWEIDGWIVIAGALAAMSSAVLGCLLLLRRLSLLGDAISHSVLPGIAAAFLFTGERATGSIFVGAAATGLLTVWIAEMIHRYGRVEESAAIGIVFTTMFSIGLVMIVRAGDHVDLDPSCILYGNLETSIQDTVATPLGVLPRVILNLGSVLLINLASILLLFKEWRITTFDPSFAKSQGVSNRFLHYLLAMLVSITCIACFEAVGNILVVAVLIVPAAIAFLICERLSWMLAVSLIAGALIAVVGHIAAISLPPLVGLRSVNSAAMMAVCAGLALAITVAFGIKHGVVTQWFVKRSMARRILLDDVLAFLYRYEEKSTSLSNLPTQRLTPDVISKQLRVPESTVRSALQRLVKEQTVSWVANRESSGLPHTDDSKGREWKLTESGRRVAQNLVRSHRQWERYLSDEVNLPDTKVHPHAELWEHFTSPSMRGKLDNSIGNSSIDPHGRAIPPEG